MSRYGADLHVDFHAPEVDNSVDPRTDIGEFALCGRVTSGSGFAGEIPLGKSLRKRLTPLAFYVFPDVAFHGFDHALIRFAGGRERENLLHPRDYRKGWPRGSAFSSEFVNAKKAPNRPRTEDACPLQMPM